MTTWLTEKAKDDSDGAGVHAGSEARGNRPPIIEALQGSGDGDGFRCDEGAYFFYRNNILIGGTSV